MYSFILRAAIVVTFFFAPFATHAATLFFSPASGSYPAGKVFSVRVLVSSTDQAMNAASGVVSFPADRLQVTSISKGSVLTLWVEDPSFSNSGGTIKFEGVLPNPGFMGSNGSVITINFRPIAEGTADVKFTSSSVLANDGSGSNILKSIGQASFNIGPAEATPEPVVPKVIEKKVEVKIPTPVATITPLETDFPNGLNILAIFAIALFVVVIGLLLYFLLWKKKDDCVSMKKRFESDLDEVEETVDQAFAGLKKDLDSDIKNLESIRGENKLSYEEMKVISKIKEDISSEEEKITKKIRKVEKDIERS